MASITLNRQVPIDEIIQILKKDFPNYDVYLKKKNVVQVNNGFAKFNVLIQSNRISVAQNLPLLIALIPFIGLFFLIILTIKSFYDPACKELIDCLKRNFQIQLNDTNSNIKNIVIPDICPNCKSPNANRSTTCEWCGNQII